MSEDLLARVWISDRDKKVFPEFEYLPRDKRSGICFSGGGTPAMVAAVGQLRGLCAAGQQGEPPIIDSVDYLSCVSGGSWAGAAFTYYQSGARDDAQLLGPIIPPTEIRAGNQPGQLGHIDRYCLAAMANKDFSDALIWAREQAQRKHHIWIDAIGRTYLQDFGLFDQENPCYFSYTDDTVAGIVARNRSLAAEQFHVVRAGDRDAKRPYLILNSTVIWPTATVGSGQMLGFQHTPLYVGHAKRNELEHTAWFFFKKRRAFGGGFVEPFAFGGQPPSGPPDEDHYARFSEPPATACRLADAVGASSAVYSSALAEFTPDYSPRTLHWPIGPEGFGQAEPMTLGDGGNIENLGLPALLQRKVKNIIVFVNGGTKLDDSYEPETSAPEGKIDDYVPSYFGYSDPSWTYSFPRNQVFEKAAFGDLLRGLREARSAGRGAVTTTMNLRVVANDLWGIEGGWDVNICWFYLECVYDWWHRIGDPDVKQAVEEGQSGRGEFASFPNYSVVLQNWEDLTKLTIPQINLLAHQTCWSVQHNRDRIQQVLNA